MPATPPGSVAGAILDATEHSKDIAEALESVAAIVGACKTNAEAVKLARQLQEKRLYVFMAGDSNGRSIAEQLAEEGQAIVDAVKVAGEAKGVKVKAITVKSDLVGDAVIAAAKKNKCDLIVMASHGRRGIKRLLLGSETQQVLTHSHIPVLVLR